MHSQTGWRSIRRAWRVVGRRWWLVILGLTLVAGALLMARTSTVDADEVRVHAIRTAQAFLRDHPAAPPSRSRPAPLDPAEQSVQSYLRAHEVTPPIWQQLRDRVWRFLRGR